MGRLASGEALGDPCGDPWHRKIVDGNSGSSLIVVRTEAGRRFLEAAVSNGYLVATKSDIKHVYSAQRNLMKKKGAIWGRITAMRLMGLPVPRHAGYQLFEAWLKLSLSDKFGSFLGTWKRILTRKYHRPSAEMSEVPELKVE
jgi:coenzyme F420 hydrogenase subunit beta